MLYPGTIGKSAFFQQSRWWIAAVLVLLSTPVLADANEINALAWCDHTDSEFLRPFEEATGIKVNVKEYDGTGTALALLEQAEPGDWDVFVVDSTDVRRMVGRGLLAELDPTDFPLTDVAPEVRLPDYHQVDGKLYAVPEKFGYNAIAYNEQNVTPADMRKEDALWNPSYKGRVAIYDYYLPVMAQVALALGRKPSELSEADLPAIREKLFAMKENAVVVGDIVTSQTALATGEADLIIGGGEFAMASLATERPEFEWALPDGGGIRWEQAVGILATAKNRDGAKRFLQYILSPEGQARLATSSCFWGMPVNTKAVLSDHQKHILRWDEQADFLSRSYPYPVVSEALDKAMQDVWTQFLQK